MFAGWKGAAGAARAIIFAGAAFALAVIASGPLEFLDTLDHKPGLLRDYHIYLSQGRAYLAGTALSSYYVYPPLLGLLLMPVTRLSAAQADAIGWLVELTVLVAYAGVLARVLRAHGRWRWPLAASLLVTSLSVLHCLKWGQVSVIVTWLCALWLLSPSRRTAFAVGVAGALKLFPLVFFLPALRWKRERLALHALVWMFLLGVALPVAAIGLPRTSQTFEHIGESAGMVASMARVPPSQDLGNAVQQWFGGGGRVGRYVHKGPWVVALPAPVQLGLRWLAAIALIAATWHGMRNAQTGSAAVAAMTMLVVPLLLPLAWEHYFAALPLAIAAALAQPATSLRALAPALVAWAIPALALWAQLYDAGIYLKYASAHGTTLAASAGIFGAWIASRAVPDDDTLPKRSKPDTEAG